MANNQSAYALIEQDAREAAMKDTWGHMAPEKHKHYEGRIVYAIDAYYSGTPRVLVSDFPGMESSPWFAESQRDHIDNISWKPEEEYPKRKGYCEPGCIYEWRGGFKNYKWRTDDIRMLMDPNEKQY